MLKTTTGTQPTNNF